jgi:hypothetical protein
MFLLASLASNFQQTGIIADGWVPKLSTSWTTWIVLHNNRAALSNED